MAPTCSETDFYVGCHQACNSLTTNETRRTKYCGHTITLKRIHHGTGVAKIVIPPPSVFVQATRISSASKLCSFCNNLIRSCFVDLANHCEELSCANVCLLSVTCSGFPFPRRTATEQALSTRVW